MLYTYFFVIITINQLLCQAHNLSIYFYPPICFPKCFELCPTTGPLFHGTDTPKQTLGADAVEGVSHIFPLTLLIAIWRCKY